MSTRKISSIIFLLLIFSTCELNLLALTNSSALVYFPTNGWVERTPNFVDLDPSILNKLVEYIEDYNEEFGHSNIDSMVITRDGYLVKEFYSSLWDPDDIHVQWSVTKSFTSALIGIAIKEGYIASVHEKVLDFFPNRTIENIDAWKEAMTIHHLLMMSTGMAYPGDDAIWNGWMTSSNQVQYILDLEMATPPGNIFNYDTGGSHLLSAIIQEATGMTTSEFADQTLFRALNITHYLWQYDRQGVNYGGHGLHITPRDMAKLGLLYMNDGVWEGEQILPVDWVKNTTQTHWYPYSIWGYGEQWWTLPNYDVFVARGRYGQTIYVDKTNQIVVVFTATLSDADPEPYFEYYTQYILESLNFRESQLVFMIFYPILFATAINFGVISFRIIRRKRRRK